jgi:hypothetical protein
MPFDYEAFVQETFAAPPATLEEALRQADAVRSQIVREAANAPYANNQGKWSAREILYHLHLVERGSASAVRRMAEGEKTEMWSDESVQTAWNAMMRLIPYRHTKITAPEGVAPKDAPAMLEDCVRLLEESRERLAMHCAKTTTEDLLRTGFPHPILGILPGLLWITFIALHEARHLHQIIELSLNYNHEV